MDDDARSIDQLVEEMREYKMARDSIVVSLLQTPGDAALLAAKAELDEVLALTEQLLQRKQAAEQAAAAAAAAAQTALDTSYTAGAASTTAAASSSTSSSAAGASAIPVSLLPSMSSSAAMRRHEQVEVIPIPEHLMIKPTDTPEEREAKKKKLHQIKKRNRMATINKETKEKQTTWKAFVQDKVLLDAWQDAVGVDMWLTVVMMLQGAKRKKGFMTTLNRESMFKTPDSVHGKVGVIGSGQVRYTTP
mgnify:FL=1